MQPRRYIGVVLSEKNIMAVELNRVIGVSNSDYPSKIKELLIGLLGFLWNHSKSPEKKRPSIEKSLSTILF